MTIVADVHTQLHVLPPEIPYLLWHDNLQSSKKGDGVGSVSPQLMIPGGERIGLDTTRWGQSQESAC